MTAPNLPASVLNVSASQRSRGPVRWLVAGSLGIVLLGGGFVAWRFFGARAGGQQMMMMPPGVPVALQPVQSGTVRNSTEFIGTLEAQSSVALQPEASGRVMQVYVSAGDRVTAGTPILLISPERTQAEVDAAQANVIAARAARDTSQAQLRSLEARRLELESELALQAEEYRRAEFLVEQGALAQQSLDIASRNRDVAQASLNAALQEIAAARSTLNQANATLGQAEANRNAAQQNLRDRTVVAPVDGIVGDISAKLGDYVSPGIVLTTIIENASLEVDLELPIDRQTEVRPGLPVELLAADGETVLASGSISFISPQANLDTQTLLVKARFNNSQGQLQDAQRVSARVIWSQSQGILVPTSAITRLGGQTFVYVTEPANPEDLPPPQAFPPDTPMPDQVARLRPVQLGSIQGNNYEVLEGLSAGEIIVASGILNLQDGTPIFPQSETDEPETTTP